jgi:hypothetical protein
LRWLCQQAAVKPVVFIRINRIAKTGVFIEVSFSADEYFNDLPKYRFYRMFCQTPASVCLVSFIQAFHTVSFSAGEDAADGLGGMVN